MSLGTGTRNVGDREVMRHGTEVVLVREGGWAQSGHRSVVAESVLVGTVAS